MNAAQHINQTSGNVEIYTPSNIIEAARRTMGGIDLDPASSAIANKRIGAAQFFSEAQNGLTQAWRGRVWMNHPFGRTANALWVNKLVSEYEFGNVTAACCICFASTSEKWFRPLLNYPQCFLSPRTNYLLPDGSVYRGVTKGSVVTYLGSDVGQFANAFRHFGAVKVLFNP